MNIRTVSFVILISICGLTFSQTVTPSGAFTYSVPIEIVQGTNGMQPNLELTHNSQNGNGILGVGWSISGLGSITRDSMTDIRFDDTDNYLYNGQRLIYVQDEAEAKLYRTEDESYLKVYAYNLNTSSSRWKVMHKDGTVVYFGFSDTSRVIAVGKDNKVQDTSIIQNKSSRLIL